MHLTVRPAAPIDAESIARVRVRAWKVAYRGHMPDEYLDSLDPTKRVGWWREQIENKTSSIFVSEANGAVVGFSCLLHGDPPGGEIGEVMALYVDPDHWREGHGRALIDATRSAAHEAGFRLLSLWVLGSNQAARAFYRDLGFEPEGTERTTDRFGFELHEVRYRLRIENRP